MTGFIISNYEFMNNKDDVYFLDHSKYLKYRNDTLAVTGSTAKAIEENFSKSKEYNSDGSEHHEAPKYVYTQLLIDEFINHENLFTLIITIQIFEILLKFYTKGRIKDQVMIKEPL